jgi:hypothetical protein
MKRILLSILSIALSVVALAQTPQAQEEKTYPVTGFESVTVGSHFEATLQEGRCNVKVNADKALLPYVQVYVRESVLYIELDEKSIPSDVKKIYRGKNAPVPVVSAIVTIPAARTLTARENALLKSNGTVFADSIQVCIEDKAAVRNFKLEAEKATVTLTKSAQADFSLFSPDATIVCEGGSRCEVAFKGAVLQADLNGTSRCAVTGEAESFSFQSKRFAKLDALQLTAPRIKADMKGASEACIQADGSLSVHLTGGSELYYAGFPTIQVDEIIHSTFAPYKNEK